MRFLCQTVEGVEGREGERPPGGYLRKPESKRIARLVFPEGSPGIAEFSFFVSKWRKLDREGSVLNSYLLSRCHVSPRGFTEPFLGAGPLAAFSQASRRRLRDVMHIHCVQREQMMT